MNQTHVSLPSVPYLSEPGAATATSLYIDGEWRAAQNGRVREILDPADASVLTIVSEGGKADTEAAIAAARRAFDGGEWRGTTAGDRGRILERIADLLQRDREEIAVMESLDTGKTIEEGGIDVDDVTDVFRYYAGLADKDAGRLVSAPEGVHSKVVYEPVGVCGMITPWNYPLLQLAWKMAPAIAAGNTMVVKPSEVTPVTTAKLVELTTEAGVPAGVVNLVLGSGPDAGAPLSQHPDVDLVSFTGGLVTGRRIMAAAAEWDYEEPNSSNCRRTSGQTRCADWLVGEDAVTDQNVVAFRDFADPASEGQPGHWDDWINTYSDFGGVHYNSGIVNHAFYLIVKGGRNARCSGPTDPQADCDVVVALGVLVGAVVLDAEAERPVEGHALAVARPADRLHAPHATGTEVVEHLPVEGAADPAPSPVRVRGDHVDVTGRRVVLADERDHEPRLDDLLGDAAREQARALVLDGVGAAAAAGFPRVLRRARRLAHAPARRRRWQEGDRGRRRRGRGLSRW